MTLTVIIADDHPMCREAARLAVLAVSPDAEMHQAATLAEVTAIDVDPDVILLDLGLPDSRGLASLIDVARARPAIPILIVSGVESDDIEHRVAARGAAGFVSKTAPVGEIVTALETILAGGKAFSRDVSIVPDIVRLADPIDKLASLTPAERRILHAMSGGRLNKQIAHDLGLSEITVKQHVKAILRKLDVLNRTQAVLVFHQEAG